MLKKLLLLLLACSAFSALAAIEKAEPHAFAELAKHEGTLLLDVRTPEEIAEGKIAGAQELDFHDPDFNDKLDQLPKEKTILIYCRSDNRSGQAASLLQEKGFTKIVDLKGGVIAWKNQKLPLVLPAEPTKGQP